MFSPFFRPLLVSPLFHVSLHLCWPLCCSSLPWVRGSGRCALPFWRWSFCIHIYLYQNWCPGQFDSTWLEGVDPPDCTVKAAGCLLCCAVGLVCLLFSAPTLQPPSTKDPATYARPMYGIILVLLLRLPIIASCFLRRDIFASSIKI